MMSNKNRIILISIFVTILSVIFLSYDINAEESPENQLNILADLEIDNTVESGEPVFFRHTIEVGLHGYLPPRVWITRSHYSGYVYKVSQGYTKDNTWIGYYEGYLQSIHVPNQIDK